jgi:ornithine cyclodeaminase/alanine dehydrogenase-like protein (mu-crystallin family)
MTLMAGSEAVRSSNPFFVSSAAAADVFSWPEAIDALAAAYGELPAAAALPPRTVAHDEGAWLRSLPALPRGGRYFGAKLMAMVPSAPQPGVEYVIVLWDRETSRIAAFVDGNQVTAFRTAATSAVALNRLAPPGPIRLVVLGSGLEAAMHVRAFAAVRPIAHLVVCSPTPARREAFAAAAARDLGCEAEPVADASKAVGAATVVLAAARSRGELPILHGEWLAPAVAVVSIGSTVPSQREIDVSVVDASDLIVCDAVDEVVEQTGDMLEATRAGVDFADRTFSLHQLVSGELDERLGHAHRRLFKSVGGGIQDVVVAEVIVRRALQAELTVPLPIEFETKH